MTDLDRQAIDQSGEATLLSWAEARGKTALLCIRDEALSEDLAESVGRLAYHVVVARKPSSALARIESGQYELIILDEGFRETGPDENSVLCHLQRQPAPVRRKSFVCLVSDQTPTLDHMAAFRLGVNMVLNVRNVSEMQGILQRALRHHEAFYAVFDDELAKRASSV